IRPPCPDSTREGAPTSQSDETEGSFAIFSDRQRGSTAYRKPVAAQILLREGFKNAGHYRLSTHTRPCPCMWTTARPGVILLCPFSCRVTGADHTSACTQ